jgi:hypothetical protein
MDESTSQPPPTPTPADAAPPAVAAVVAAAALDVSLRLRVTTCPDCSLLFALPAEYYVQRQDDADAIYCPRGCLIHLTPPPATDLPTLAAHAALLAEVRQLKLDRDRLLNLTATQAPAAAATPIDAKELKRRCAILVERAEHAEYGHPLCRFCGKTQRSNYRYREHLQRSHPLEVADLPASYFNLP